jgi:hypothetical protein
MAAGSSSGATVAKHATVQIEAARGVKGKGNIIIYLT